MNETRRTATGDRNTRVEQRAGVAADPDDREAVDQSTRDAVARSARRGVDRYLESEAPAGGDDR